MEALIRFLNDLPFTALSNLIGVVGVPYAVWSLFRQQRERKRLDAMLIVRLKSPSRHLDIPIRRRDLTRAEVQGRLRNFHPSPNFNLAHLSSVAYLDDIETLRDGYGQRLEIPCTDAELDAFAAELPRLTG